MIKQSWLKSFSPLIWIFVVISALLIGANYAVEDIFKHTLVLFIGNLILFLITLASFKIYFEGVYDKNHSAFFRSFYLGMMLKMFSTIFIVLFYVAIFRKGISKPGVLGSMFFYLIYTFVEVSILSKLQRSLPKNA
ncbi:hypothetical protein [Gynurincola endophyticus]|jgi:hypothetical protein|uniref:hypothetical protein n=1 Tax=Gynurincola endophyticus TaxID=2479004 RepID=UPI000F8E3D81|nr:hypothetical protein [Gynurincola endophyticus]